MQAITTINQRQWTPFSVENSKGYEFLFNLIGTEHTDAYSVDLVRVAPGGYSPVHVDPDSHAFYFMEGQGRVTVAGKAHDVRAGSIVKIPFGAMHSIQNTGDVALLFLTIYDPPRQRR